MKAFFQPASALMRRLSLLPKFGIVALLFSLPAIIVTGLLINELNKAISFSVQERVGVQQMQTLHQLLDVAQQLRGLRHLALAGNGKAKEAAQAKQEQFTQLLIIFEKSNFAVLAPNMAELKRNWQILLSKVATSKSRESYLEHSALLEQLAHFNRQLANVANLSLDPEIETNYLIDLFAKNLPELTDELSDVGARGASYIDTGLLEPNEDLLISANVMLAKRDIERLNAAFHISLQQYPSQQKDLQGYVAVLSENRQFLERAKNEVLNTLNQTSGSEFLAASQRNTSTLFALAAKVAQQIEQKLEQRIARDQLRRNLMLGVVVFILLVAAYLLTGFYLAFSAETNELSEAVAHVSGGNLNRRIYSHGSDEIAQLLNAFDGMRGDLLKLVKNIRESSESITTAAEEIAHGNADLSNRTEQQASSLAETTASMAALTEAVKHNLLGAEHASANARTASQVAQAGGAAVAQVINTMDGIEKSSKKISDIIGVIDGIAFQTNILALNAAVEAARAGEQGRGFAVVASEVRNLAQRSAGAAKEIKQLITQSVEQVNAGSTQVRSAGQTMQNIVDSITKVTATMHEITDASAEQSSSILHVNEALRQIDQITQQNAALVEEAAAAAESMHVQALKLTHAVAVFEI